MPIFTDSRAFCNEIGCEFYEPKIICIDYGTKKIGVALSDDERNIAFKKNILIGNWLNITQAAEIIESECKKNNSNVLVIGYPKKLDGTLSENCKKIIQIANFIEKKYEKKAILLFDERFSTKATKSIFNTRLAVRCDRKKINKINNHDDDSAACLILNDVLRIINSIV